VINTLGTMARGRLCGLALGLALAWVATPWAGATPANRKSLANHYDRFLPKAADACATCHEPSAKAGPESLEEIPHNSFGARLKALGLEWKGAGKRSSLPSRLEAVALEDADGDGVANEVEILAGSNPGRAESRPSGGEMAEAAGRIAEFKAFDAGWRWRPFEPVARPEVPAGVAGGNAIDAFLEAERGARGLKARPEAEREVLLRRVYLDLVGLNPTPGERAAFLSDRAPGAYERLVERLLNDPRHGERWGRHWMDIWRYSDWAGWTDGKQIRDSQPHIWRWRDWIVESVNADKPYDAMAREMLAADELAPEDPDALRATGFLARNYKMLSREQWMEDAVKHTSQAFMGLTMGCAKCHNHLNEPVSQREYYAMRAIFEPHQTRIDRVPGELDTAKDGLPRVYDAKPPPTYLFARGDERHPMTNEVIEAGVPAFLGGEFAAQEVALPRLASRPDERPFVVEAVRARSAERLAAAEAACGAAAKEEAPAARRRELELEREQASRAHEALLAVLEAERAGRESAAATNATRLQRAAALTGAVLRQARAARELAEASGRLAEAVAPLGGPGGDSAENAKALAAAEKAAAEARKKLEEGEKGLAAAREASGKPLDGGYEARVKEVYPETSSGRRLAFARWLTAPEHPLTARVAANHIWLRHFGRGLAPTPADFGRNGRVPTNGRLLDWLAAELMAPAGAEPWSMKHLHRLIVTSAAYRMASTPDGANLALDPDNEHWWRMDSRRLEAEVVRDNLLQAGGELDLAMGGAEIDHMSALTSRRRSIYLRQAAEKQAEFLQIFDGPAVTDCYLRRSSVMPQQALALGNSELALRQARRLAARLGPLSGGDPRRFAELAFELALGRGPTAAELEASAAFLSPKPASAGGEAAPGRRAENFALTLFNHNDFVTVR